jgi:hypothetical protein
MAQLDVLFVCLDKNECADSLACSNGECINTNGSFMCRCYPGFIINLFNPYHCEGLPSMYNSIDAVHSSLVQISTSVCRNIRVQQQTKSAITHRAPFSVSVTMVIGVILRIVALVNIPLIDIVVSDTLGSNVQISTNVPNCRWLVMQIRGVKIAMARLHAA